VVPWLGSEFHSVIMNGVADGDLHAAVGEGTAWGSFQPDGSFKLSKELIFDKLGPGRLTAGTGAGSFHDPARDEPRAAGDQRRIVLPLQGLDEGLTEYVAVKDVAAFADTAGYGELPDAKPEYPA